ncbi:hypothetical protein GCM10011371_05570 [Novosphingobium marinum]|uniref:PilZ domain-containing protein n=1 Tax=Novosphingobium marinum TaxID=1514948 RepID=A0A7Y9XVQ6_9SPHN|nr:PilZ domain-containing protein [Novosphingobium marinum]NYH94245.1 hypothetical protein [Novosphingobium marinum]GGC20815.1 hypothetical protein GCM10011371_05570 [Novosphingobium marinum]
MKQQRTTKAPPSPREDGERADIALRCEARQGTRPWSLATLGEMSRSGFRISGIPSPLPEVPLRIRIPGFQTLTAHIRWIEGDTIGCEFAQPLHVAVFDHIVRIARGG